MAITQRLFSILAVVILWSAAVQAAELTPQQIYAGASPGVVMVMGHSTTGDKGNAGTGSIIRRDGLVLTNAHVVVEERTGKPYPRLFVYLKPDRVTGDPKTDLSRGVKATVLAFSQPLDLALLRLEGTPAPLSVLELSDSSRVRIGDRVLAIGHPEQGGLWTLTTGVISAEFENFNKTRGKHVFQTETGLNRGNSGGPLLDTEGRVVGVNTAIARLAADGLPITSISFSLKSDVARTWLREQGITVDPSGSPTDLPASATKPAPAKPSVTPSSPSQTAATSGTPGPSASAQAPPAPQPQPPARSYNLDRLVSERAKAEADMENMIKEMRGKLRGR
ncbi:MAG: S1C family serine protease [Nitrospiraceae bacterium]